MTYFLRDDRVTEREAARINHGRPERYWITNTSPGLSRVGDAFVHSARVVMHDECCHAFVPGVDADDATARHDARDAWAEQFGPGQALCWVPLYTNDPARALPCFWCGEPVVGRC